MRQQGVEILGLHDVAAAGRDRPLAAMTGPRTPGDATLGP
jgi:hypothetical protein